MTIPTPYELVKLLGINDYFAGLPTLRKKDYVIVSMRQLLNWKKSFRSGQNRALMVLATGAGKTIIPHVLLHIVFFHILQ